MASMKEKATITEDMLKNMWREIYSYYWLDVLLAAKGAYVVKTFFSYIKKNACIPRTVVFL
jgi:hypothetical protein